MALLRIFGQSSTAARTSSSTRPMPSIRAARFASSTRSISTAIQDSMWEALSPWAIRCERLGIAAVSPLEMPRVRGDPRDLDQFAALPVAGHDEQRVHHKVDGGLLPDQFGVDRVNEEGHVVGDDVDDTAVRLVGDGDVGDAREPLRRRVAVRLCPCCKQLTGIRAGVFLGKVLVVVLQVAFSGTDRNGLILHAGPRRHRQTPPSRKFTAASLRPSWRA